LEVRSISGRRKIGERSDSDMKHNETDRGEYIRIAGATSSGTSSNDKQHAVLLIEMLQ
jgi:hypothetical protein